MSRFLEHRVAQLEGQAREGDLNFEEVADSLPEDPRARSAALATVLGLDALSVLREDVTLEQLVQERDARRQAVELAAREAEEAGVPLPGTGGGGKGEGHG